MSICQAVNKTNGNPCRFKAVNSKYCDKHKDYINHDVYGTDGFTTTFAECAENHKGMQQIKLNDKNIPAFTKLDLDNIISKWKGEHLLVNLRDNLINTEFYNKTVDAYVLILKNFVNNKLEFFNELKALNWDTKFKDKGEVKNKKARHNICFSDNSQEPDYEAGKGRIIPFNDVPILNNIKNELFKYTNLELVAEGNRYYNINYCGIGYHGDTERKIVIGIRSGCDFPLKYRWFYQSKPIGDYININLKDGDLYIMSDKAVGHDWLLRNTVTLRHAAGCDDYTVI